MENKKLDIVVILGSVRSERLGIRAAKFIINKLKEKNYNVTLVDPLEYKLPLLDKMYKEYEKGKAPEVLEKLAKIIIKSDAYVVVTAEYNHSIPPALTNLLDHFMEEYFYKPSGIVCYSVGPFGGVRASMQLRALLPEVGSITIPTIFPISNIGKSLDENGKDITEKNDYERRVGKFIEELEWYSLALKNHRNKTKYKYKYKKWIQNQLGKR